MDLVLDLTEDEKIPLHQRLTIGLRKAIKDGRLPPGQLLPSTRELAESLKISRATVRRSYDDLCIQGFAMTTPGGGTYVVADHLEMPAEIKRSEPFSQARIQLSEFAKRALSTEKQIPVDAELFAEANYFGFPSSELLPTKSWKRCLFDQLRDPAWSYQLDPFGWPPLRTAIAGYLRRTRGITCSSNEIAVFSGSQPALDLLCRITLGVNDSVVVENPGYPGARRMFLMHGAKIIPVGVDGNGLIVSDLLGCPEKPRMIYLTPPHHDPTGAVLSLERRKQILFWARQNEVLVVEDDYDSELRYGAKPLQAMKALDDHGSVVYIKTLWRLLTPMVRLGFAVLPPHLVAPLRCTRAMTERDSPELEQRALATFIETGHLERYVKSLRAVYLRRRQILLHALTMHLSNVIKIPSETAGLHVTVRFSSELSTDLVLSCAQRASLPLIGTTHYYIDTFPANEFLIPFASLSDNEIEAKIAEFSRQLLTSD